MAAIGQRVTYQNPDGGTLVGIFQGTRMIAGTLYFLVIDAARVWHLIPVQEVPR